MSTVLRVLALSTATASAVTGGALLAFSTFVMPALRSLPVAQGVAAMQAINVAAPQSVLFMTALGASALGSVVTGGYALVAGGPGRWWLVAGAVLGVSVIAITAGYHVPRNDALAVLDPSAPGTAATWATYLDEWVRWNHARAAAGVLGAVAIVVGVLKGA